MEHEKLLGSPYFDTLAENLKVFSPLHPSRSVVAQFGALVACLIA